MTLSGRRVWAALGAALLVGGAAGSFASGYRKARGIPPMESSADAGVRLVVDAGTVAACDCATEVKWRTVEVPVPVTRYIRADAGMVEVRVVESYPVLVPDLSLRGNTVAASTTTVGGEASATAAAKVTAPEPGVSLLWGVGGGVQHDDALRGIVGGELGLAWGRSSIKVAGGVAPLKTDRWSALLLYGGEL